jgi:FkbM family methyltransferase
VTPKPKNAILLYRAVDFALRFGLRRLPASTWAEHVALWWGYRFRPETCVVKLRSGALIQVDPTDYLQLMIYYLGTFEPHCLRYLKACVGKGATIVDVGANIGLFTLEGSLAVGPSGRVISVEAAPSNARVLRGSIQLNGMGNVSVIEVAAGEARGMATLTLGSEGNQGMFTLGSVTGKEKYDVEVRPLDELLDERKICSVDFMKMDIEGSEYRALRGAERTLRTHQPVLLIELNESALQKCQSSTSQVKDLLRELGYRGWVIDQEANRPVPEGQVTHECDECLFVPKGKEGLIRGLGLQR